MKTEFQKCLDACVQYREQLDRLEAENDMLKQQIAKLQKPDEAWLKQKLNDLMNGRTDP